MARFPFGIEPPPDEEHYAGQGPGDGESPTCARCGADGLEWVDIGMKRWRLYDGKKMHVCPNTTKASDFPDLSQ